MADEREVRFVVNQLEQFTERLMRSLTLEVTANLIEATPVDTGWARANWVPNIRVPIEVTSGTRQQAEEGVIDRGPQQQGIDTVATQYRLPNGAIFVSNNVDYILRLNEGSSTQAPSGFVQVEILRAIRRVTSRGNAS